MKKIKVELENIVDEIEKFYDEKSWHFMTLNALSISGDMLEVQWMFLKYDALDEVFVYYVEVKSDEEIPSITHIVPSAIISQMEIVDMFGIKVQNSNSGLYLEKDSKQAPLMGCGI